MTTFDKQWFVIMGGEALLLAVMLWRMRRPGPRAGLRLQTAGEKTTPLRKDLRHEFLP